MVGGNKHLFEKPFLRIYKIYDYSSVYGVVTGGDSRKLATCFRSYMQENIARIYQHVADNVEAIEVIWTEVHGYNYKVSTKTVLLHQA